MIIRISSVVSCATSMFEIVKFQFDPYGRTAIGYIGEMGIGAQYVRETSKLYFWRTLKQINVVTS